jgi:hypothetical protein
MTLSSDGGVTRKTAMKITSVLVWQENSSKMQRFSKSNSEVY